MVDFQSLSIMIASAGVLIASIYYALTLRSNNKTRQAQLFMQIYDKWSDPTYEEHFWTIMRWEWKNVEDFNSKYVNNISDYAKFASVDAYLEGIGVFVKQGLIDPRRVDDLMSTQILLFWEKFGPLIVERRAQYNRPAIAEWAEYLYNVIKPIAERERLKAFPELKT